MFTNDLFEQKGERPRAKKFSVRHLQNRNNDAVNSKTNQRIRTPNSTGPKISCADIQKGRRTTGKFLFIGRHGAESCIEELPIVTDLLQVLSELPTKKPSMCMGCFRIILCSTISIKHIEKCQISL